MKTSKINNLLMGLIGSLMLVGLLIACGDETPTNPPGLANPAPQQTRSGSNPAPAASGPQVGANGQITVVAPPASGQDLPGIYFWVKENNIWQGGKATENGKPLTQRELGGKQLTKAAPLALAKSPALSPDGSKLAYAYSPEPEGNAGNIIIGQDIYLIDVKTGANNLLIKRDEPQTFLDNPAWNSDGKYLYFDARTPRKDQSGAIVGENISVNRVEIATGKREKLLEDARESRPLPGDKQLVYVSVAASTGTYETNLKVIDLITKQSTILLDPAKGFVGAYMPRPSPDGQTIVFSAAGGPDSMFSQPQQNQPQPKPTTSSQGQPNFTLGLTALLPSLASAKTAPALHGIPFDIWVIKPDGSGLKRLTTLYEDQPMPTWSKDGKKIAFLAGQGFYVVDTDGKNLTKISDAGGHSGFDWRD